MHDLNRFIEERRYARIRAYREMPSDLKAHHGIEEDVADGYAYRQILELVQNGADAISDAAEIGNALSSGRERIEVLLAGRVLYAANTGAPLTKDGIESLLSSHSSPKRGNQIGRFGLGFKSLLKLGGRIDMISTSAALRFDPERCREELRGEFKVDEVPGLRLAWALDRKVEFDEDVILQRFDWATTVVRAVVSNDSLMVRLREDLSAFPAEFLLFPRSEFSLRLDDGQDAIRILTRKASDHGCTLFDGADESHWRVVTRRGIVITDETAIEDARNIHARGTVDISWATPLDATQSPAGQFWAFFATQTLTGMAGILNAPWKLTPDRSALISGPWNDRLMTEAADIIVMELPALATSKDCGRHLDAFPAGKTANHLVEEVWKGIEAAAIIPNMVGSMCSPMHLFRHPWDFREINRAWGNAACPEDLERYVHYTCLSGARGSRLEILAKRIESARGKDSTEFRFLGLPNLRRKPEVQWFDAIASEEVGGAIRAFQLARALRDELSGEKWRALRPKLTIIPTVADGLKQPDQVFFAPPETEIPGKFVVAADLAENAEAKALATEVMEVKTLDESGWQNFLDKALKAARNIPYGQEYRELNVKWENFWITLRSSPASCRCAFIDKHAAEIRVQRSDGQWVSRDEILLQGELIDVNDSSNSANLVHPTSHKGDTELLEHLGVRRVPSLIWQPWPERGRFDSIGKVFDRWLEAVRGEYRSALRPGKQLPQASKLVPDEFSMPDGWHFLATVTGRSNAILTAKLLALISSGDFKSDVILCYRRRKGDEYTRSDDYPKPPFPHPILWLLMQYGWFSIGESIIRLATVTRHRDKAAMSLLPKWNTTRKALDLIGRCDLPPSASGEEREFWNAMFEAVVTRNGIDKDLYQDLWADAASDGIVPTELAGGDRPVPLSETYVTASRDLARHARDGERMVVSLGEAALRLWLDRGALDLAQILRPQFDAALGPVASLVSVNPELKAVLKGEDQENDRFCGNCQIVSGLRLSMDGKSTGIPCLVWDGVLRLDDDQMACVTRSERLRLLIAEISGAGWLRMDADAAFREMFDQGVAERRERVAAADSLSARLLLAVGNRVEPLRLALGKIQDKPFLESCSPQELSELVLGLLGPTALSNLVEAMKLEGLNPPPPARWNTAEAREFVAGIGFPLEFATTPKAGREPEESISGPIPLPDLHEYQVEVYCGIQDLIATGNGRRRAVVSLPTGGGKTRVVVQAAVDLVLKPEGDRRSVLWVAQTDELCEQAVQAFRQVWINRGAINTPLRIIRLWGRYRNPTPPSAGRPVVVVASIQTLNNRIGDQTAQWLSKPGIWVVDECHHAITRSYTRVLRWLDAEVPGTVKPDAEEPPIIGLSATPFRGSDDEESLRLAKRFDQRWFPKDQAALYDRLRSQGVLSIVDHESLESTAALTGAELEILENLGSNWEGVQFDNIIESFNQRLAGDGARNKLLLDRLQNADEKSILFFGNSVEHSQEIAARLHLIGIRAAAISGETPAAARRQFLDQFQKGVVRVICNHSVLATGFDAPKIDMILIARQVFSPVRYMQMVGRGLRGVKNGGTERCRVVTVMDNLGRFQDKHPYHYCRQYFHETGSF